MHILWRERMAETIGNGMGLDTIWSGYTFILGFLIVFRSNQAYSRFWESAPGTRSLCFKIISLYSHIVYV